MPGCGLLGKKQKAGSMGTPVLLVPTTGTDPEPARQCEEKLLHRTFLLVHVRFFRDSYRLSLLEFASRAVPDTLNSILVVALDR
jgi:hypothetical protein